MFKNNAEKMNPQVDPDHYSFMLYDTKARFISYWYQINEIIKLNPNKVLEIGVGNGFVSKYLKDKGVNVTTLDIDERLNPDVVGNILDMPFSKNHFDVVSCCEILEHLPYENFKIALSEIFRINKIYTILSLPDVSRFYRFYVQIPNRGTFKKIITLPRLKNPIHRFDGEHYWEIGKEKYSLRKIINDIQKINFKIEKIFRLFENPDHRFFILKKLGR